MTVDRSSAAIACAPSSDDGDGPDAEARRRDARRRSNERPHCSRCGRFDSGPGGAGFGDGKTFCEACALRLDFERGDGRTR
jgi:hypothetical protein